MKQAFHQNIVGRKIIEDVTLAEFMENRRFQYYGLVGPECEVIGAWIKNDGVYVLVVDSIGKTAEVYMPLFVLKAAA